MEIFNNQFDLKVKCRRSLGKDLGPTYCMGGQQCQTWIQIDLMGQLGPRKKIE